MNNRTLTLATLLTTSLALSACTTDDDPAADDTGEASTGTDPTGEDSTGEDPGEDSTGEDPGQDSTGEPDDPFADCERGVIEDDLVVIDTMGMPGAPRWYGPGADPETGELLDDGATTFHVSATYLARQTTDEATNAFFSSLPAINEALFTNPGMVALQLGDSFACNTSRTFTVWTDEAAMLEFVTSDAHVQAATQVGVISRGGSVVTSWSDASPSEITWEAALAQLDAVDPMY